MCKLNKIKGLLEDVGIENVLLQRRVPTQIGMKN
jgi:hypothetical protein